MTIEQALYQFWSQFGIEAYEENSVPEDAPFPRITYQVVTDTFDNDVSMSISVWDLNTSWTEINKITRLIENALNAFVQCDGGAIWLKRGTPFAQNMGDESNDRLKRKYIQVIAEYILQ